MIEVKAIQIACCYPTSMRSRGLLITLALCLQETREGYVDPFCKRSVEWDTASRIGRSVLMGSRPGPTSNPASGYWKILNEI